MKKVSTAATVGNWSLVGRDSFETEKSNREVRGANLFTFVLILSF